MVTKQKEVKSQEQLVTSFWVDLFYFPKKWTYKIWKEKKWMQQFEKLAGNTNWVDKTCWHFCNEKKFHP